MEGVIEKKVFEYKQKISNCDNSLGEAAARKGYLRNRIKDKGDKATGEQFELVSIKLHETKLETQRQCYVQAMHDFDSLLDWL